MRYEIIIQKVIEILNARSRNKLTVSYMNKAPSQKDLITYGQIEIKDVSLSFLQNYLGGECFTTWGKLIRQAEIFGNDISLWLASDSILYRLRPECLHGCKAKIYSETGAPVFTVKSQMITYAEILFAPVNCILFLRENQMLTPLAKEEMSKNNIKIIKRV